MFNMLISSFFLPVFSTLHQIASNCIEIAMHHIFICCYWTLQCAVSWIHMQRSGWRSNYTIKQAQRTVYYEKTLKKETGQLSFVRLERKMQKNFYGDSFHKDAGIALDSCWQLQSMARPVQCQVSISPVESLPLCRTRSSKLSRKTPTGFTVWQISLWPRETEIKAKNGCMLRRYTVWAYSEIDKNHLTTTSGSLNRGVNLIRDSPTFRSQEGD